MIKAIETRYKGYRFRSRLEARWAVFFDALGLEWEYEPEGYELSDGTWYLPDFRINGNTFEIKPLVAYKSVGKKPNVYMAGTMRSGDGWRGIGVTDRKNRKGIGWESNNLFNYCGPFSFSCDHGCSHGQPHTSFSCLSVFNDESRKKCIEECFSQIEKCDVFALYIDRADLYGSLVELGYAKSLGKEIWIGINPDIKKSLSKTVWQVERSEHGEFEHELWFAQQCSDFSVNCTKEDARSEFDKFLARKLTKEQSQCILMGENHFVLYGDPVDFNYISNNNYPPFWFNHMEINPSAAIKARSARFEHGEKG